MVTNHLRAPYGVYFTKNCTILRRPYGAQPAAGRIVRFFIIFLDIVRCLVKFRYYLKFHGTRTAFGRVIEGKMTSAGHRTVSRRRPAGVCTHRPAPDNFCFNFISYDFNGASCDVLQSPETVENLLTNRPMPVWAPDDARSGTGRCFMSQTATGEKRRVFAEEHIVFIGYNTAMVCQGLVLAHLRQYWPEGFSPRANASEGEPIRACGMP